MTEFEQTLRRLKPQSALSRDSVLFEAGRASSRRSRVWPAIAGIATACALALGVMLWRQPGPVVQEKIVVVEKVIEKIVEVPVPSEPLPQPLTQSPSRDPQGAGLAEYLKERDDALRWGLQKATSLPTWLWADEARGVTEVLTPASVSRLMQEF